MAKENKSIFIKAQILIIKLNQIQAFQIEIRVSAKHKQDSLNIKPYAHINLSLTEAQKCNYFVY